MIERAVQILRSGGLVAFPTETVYGLGADARNADAVAKIFAAKGRPGTNPLIVHIGAKHIARIYASHWPDAAEALADTFWPGPLTLIVSKTPAIVDAVSAGTQTVGLRVPSHPIAQQLLTAFGGPIAAPSANRSNRVSPTAAQHVREEFGHAIDCILDGGSCAVGIESTVLDLTSATPTILRPGSVSRDQIAQIVGRVETLEAALNASTVADSPGQQAIHYAPRTPTFWFDASSPAPTSDVSTVRIVIGDGLRFAARILSMPPRSDAYARALYQTLRQADAMGVEQIWIELPPNFPEWVAVRDRILRAARPIERRHSSQGARDADKLSDARGS